MAPRLQLLVIAVLFVAALGWLAGKSWAPAAREPNYQFILAWGQPGSRPGEFQQPIGIAVAGDSLAVIGTSGAGPGEFDAPGGVAVSPGGELYVADFYNHRVQVLSSRGRFLRQLGVTRKKGIRGGYFNYPTDVALLPDGSLAVADAYNDRVQVFAPDGTLLSKWGGPFALNISGSLPGWFKTATAVCADSEGSLFVADFYNHRVQEFTAKGEFLVAIGHHGKDAGQFDRPTDVAVDTDGNLYVVDFGNNRIQKFAQTDNAATPSLPPSKGRPLDQGMGLAQLHP